MTRPSQLRLLGVARLTWGVVLVLAPDAVLGDLPHERIDRSARTVARILGIRQLAEAAFTARRSRGLVVAGVAVDALHAVTFALLARLRPDRRRLALTNVATAAAFSVGGIAESRRTRGGA